MGLFGLASTLAMKNTRDGAAPKWIEKNASRGWKEEQEPFSTIQGEATFLALRMDTKCVLSIFLSD